MDIKYQEKGDIKNESDLWRRWKSELDAAERCEESYLQECDKILEIYSARSTKDKYRNFSSKTKTRFNVLWANIETLKPATYSKEPKPLVSTRNQGKDDTARVASMIEERVLRYNNEEINIQINTLIPCRNDYLLFARGLPWCRFTPEIESKEQPIINELGEPVIDESGEPATQSFSQVVNARVDCDHVNYKDIKFSPCREWPELRWGSRKAYMTRDALVERFGKLGRDVNLTHTGKSKDDSAEDYGVFARGEVEEIWDKDSKKVYWLSPGLPDKFLDVKPDPLKLKGFFPFPRPACGTMGDSITPTPDYLLYRDLARDLDIIWQRVTRLEAAMKWAGCYNEQYPELAKALTGPEDNFVPIADWGSFLTTAGGVGGGVQFVPYKEVIEVIARLYDAGRQKLEAIYQITGLSDVIRGYSDPDETATATRTKGEAAGLRIRDRQEEMARLVRDLYAIEAEIIAEWFPPEIIMEQAAVSEFSQEDQALVPAALELLKSDMKRSFRIEIESDATVELDRNQEKQRRMEFADTVSSMMGKLIPMAKQAPETAPVVSEIINFVARGMGAGRELEGAIGTMLEGLKQPPKPPPQEPLDPRVQTEAQKVQLAMSAEQRKAAELELATKKATDDAQFKREKLAADTSTAIRDQNMEMVLHKQTLSHDADVQALKTGAQMFPLPFQPT
jgi:hypothetical protein